MVTGVVSVQKGIVKKKGSISRRKIWKLKESQSAKDFHHEVNRMGVECEGMEVENLWETVRERLLTASDKICGWTKSPARHTVKWWWDDEVDRAIREKRKCWG